MAPEPPLEPLPHPTKTIEATTHAATSTALNRTILRPLSRCTYGRLRSGIEGSKATVTVTRLTIGSLTS